MLSISETIASSSNARDLSSTRILTIGTDAIIRSALSRFIQITH
jgi:hypothetical protein